MAFSLTQFINNLRSRTFSSNWHKEDDYLETLASGWEAYEIDQDTTTVSVPAGYGVSAAAVKIDSAWTAAGAATISISDYDDTIQVIANADLKSAKTYFGVWGSQLNFEVEVARDYLVAINGSPTGTATLYLKLEILPG